MSRFIFVLLISAALMSSMAMAFSTTPSVSSTTAASSSSSSSSKLPVFSPIRVMQGASSPAAFLGRSSSVLLLSDEKKEASPEGAVAEKPATPGDGTFYDDEVEPAKKVGISNAMRDRLMREASSGLDSDKKQTNVILYIILGVTILVILGGAGIFY